MPTKTTADAFFTLQQQTAKAKEEISDEIAAALGFDWGDENCPAIDIRFDYYDCSFELDGVQNDFALTRSQWKGIAEIGFDRCWLNHIDGSESYYYMDSRCNNEPRVSRKNLQHKIIGTPMALPN